jgi:Tfp pilus assembly protein PilF
MKTLGTLVIGLCVLIAFAGCSKEATYNPNAMKDQVPSLEQQTVPPGQARAAAEFLETGKRKWRVGDEKHAVKNFEKALEKNPYNFEANYWMAIVGRDNHRWEESSFHFAQAVQYCPPGRWESRIRVDWGYLFELQGQKGMAAKQYDLALLADPNFREAQSARSRVLNVPSASYDK